MGDLPIGSVGASAQHAETERIDRGAVAYLNDLHKGRQAGQAWSWFIDIFAIACFLFALTGLLLLQLQ